MRPIDERKAGTVCCRCDEARWPFKGWSEPYLCGRCLLAIWGGNARDPLFEPSEAQQRVSDGLQKYRFRRQLGGEILEISPDSTSDPSHAS